MKLRTLRIQNLRCCKDVTIQLDSMHAIVGANNAGKSTILRAIDFLINPSTTKVTEEAFARKDLSLEIRIEGVFTDLTSSEEQALDYCLKDDRSFHLARTAKFADSDDESGEKKVVISQQYNKPMPKPTFDWLVEGNVTAASIKKWMEAPDNLTANGHSFVDLLGGKQTVSAWKAAAKEFTSKHLREADLTPTWVSNPQGFPNVLKATLPHFELIPAVRDVNDESKVLKTNPFGRLINQIVQSIEDGLKNEIASKLQETTRKLNRHGESERLAAIVDIENSMKGFLDELMPADLEIEFQSPTLESVLSAPRIYVDDGFKGAIDGKGHGLQRAVIFSILRSYAELVTKRREKDKRTLILGVEEPELYMHPTAQRTIRRVLRTIAEGGDQVIYSTHSPLLVDVAYFDEIIRVQPASDVDGAKIYQLPMQAIIDDISQRHPSLNVSKDSIRERYGHAYTPTRNEGFFARQVLLVEGQTETYSLPIYARSMGHEFDTMGLAVVDCGGKQQIDRLYRIFNELGIACYVLFDYDKFGDSDAISASRQLMEFLGCTDGPPNTPIIGETFSCFVETWDKDLRPEIADIDAHLDAAGKYLGRCGKPLKERYVATKLTGAEPPFVPPTLHKIISKAVNAHHRSSCLKSKSTKQPTSLAT